MYSLLKCNKNKIQESKKSTKKKLRIMETFFVTSLVATDKVHLSRSMKEKYLCTSAAKEVFKKFRNNLCFRGTHKRK